MQTAYTGHIRTLMNYAHMLKTIQTSNVSRSDLAFACELSHKTVNAYKY